MMKYLILLLIAIVASVQSQSTCFSQDTGFSAVTSIVAYNSINDADTKPQSYFESAYLSTDYVNQLFGIQYEIISSNISITAQLIFDGQKNIMYYIHDGDCYQEELAFEIPGRWPMNSTTNNQITLGKTPVNLVKTIDPLFMTVYIYDLVNCAVMSVATQNTDASNPGVSTSLYFDYQNEPEEYLFVLPASCNNPSNFKSLPKSFMKPLTLTSLRV